MRRLLLLATLAMLATPALAWEYSEQEGADDTVYGAYADDIEGAYQLGLDCPASNPDDAALVLFTPAAYGSADDYPEVAPLTVTVDGVAADPLGAVFEDTDGMLALVVYASDDDGVRPLFERLRQARESVTVTSGEISARFDVDNIAGSIGEFLASCAAGPTA